MFEDGNSTPFVKQAIQNATSTGLPFSQAKIYFIHYGHAMNDLVEGSAIKGGDGLTPSDLPGADAYFQSNWVCSGANPPVAARPLVDKYILTPWQSNPLGKLLLNQKIDLNVAPFRLLAIANRIDQRAVNGAGQAVDAGGGRFVFGAVYNNGSACVRLPFTMIFEYQQKATGNAALLALANQWHALGGAAWGPSYNSALQQLTAQFSAGSSPVLTALRTNEVALAPIAQSWEMREFHLGSTGFALAQATANPDASLDNTPALANVMNSYNCVTNPMAATDQGAVAPNAPALWNAPGASPTQRHQFALNGTCAGCHYLETGTFGFTHVAPRERATPATLSSFLTGGSTAGTACCGGSTVTVQDPVTPGDAGPGPYTFNEMKRRADYLGTLLSAGVNPPGGGCVP